MTTPMRSPGARPLDRDADTPLWMQLLADVHRRIDNREFDDAFPGEIALQDQYGVSRYTVRRALQSLRDAGVVSAGRGQSPRVAHPGIEQPLGTLYSLYASVESAGMTQRSSVFTLAEVTDSDAAGHLGLAPGDPLIYLERLRLADDQPLALDHAWLPAVVARPLLRADFSHTALYRELADRCGVHPRGGQEEIDAVTLTPDEAQRLDCPTGAAAFAVRRLGCAEGRPIEWRHTLVRADRFRLLAHFSPTTGYRVDPRLGRSRRA